MVSTASNPMGLKRICTSCGARFFDMNKRPITCPTCETEFTGEIKVKARRGRAAAAEEKPTEDVKAVASAESEEEDIIEEEDAGVEVVSLDDADEKTSKDEKPSLESDNTDDADIVPDFGVEIDDELGGDDDTLLDEDDD